MKAPASAMLHRHLAPEMAYGRHRGPSSSSARTASVVLLICRENDQRYIPLTRRSRRLRDHAGQISFPGGSIDQGESPWESGQRELREELGIEPNQVKLLQELPSIYIFGSDFLVYPFVAEHKSTPLFQINSTEVEELIRFPIDSPWTIEKRFLKKGIAEHAAWGYSRDGHYVWGATAMMLSEFLLRLEQGAYEDCTRAMV